MVQQPEGTCYRRLETLKTSAVPKGNDVIYFLDVHSSGKLIEFSVVLMASIASEVSTKIPQIQVDIRDNY